MNTNPTNAALLDRQEHKRGAIFIRRLISRALFLGVGLSLGFGLLMGSAARGWAAGVAISGGLHNFDVRYPNTIPGLPNDLEVIVYGAGLTTADVVGTYSNPQWGSANSITASVGNDPTSPGFGLNCITVRWVGAPTTALVGQMRHFGVRMKIGAAVAHQEVWWTLNGQRINRPDAPQVTWISSTTNWLVCVANPTPNPIYVYGSRWFAPGTNAALPSLSQLNTTINPTVFGAAGWTNLALPVGQVFTIQPYGRIYFKVSVTPARPIVFQLAARNVSESQLPLPVGTAGPNPADIDPTGEFGTTSILTTRASQEFAEDINGDGAVGTPDFNALRTRFGTISQDQ
jgi:hypothetical protein